MTKETRNLKYRIRREIKILKRYERDEQFSLYVQGMIASLQWLLWEPDGFAKPHVFVEFGISGREKNK